MGEKDGTGITGVAHRLACLRDSVTNIEETMRTINHIIQGCPHSRLASLLEIQQELAQTSLDIQTLMQRESASARNAHFGDEKII